jgi:hypothetical protein
VLGKLIGPGDVAQRFSALPLHGRRPVVATLLVVTILPTDPRVPIRPVVGADRAGVSGTL